MELDATMKNKNIEKDFKKKRSSRENAITIRKKKYIARKCSKLKKKKIKAIKAKKPQ
jgi:hypothetical protein